MPELPEGRDAMITTLSGQNFHALKTELDQIAGDFTTKHGKMSVEKIDGEEAEYTQITEALQSQPFLSSKKMVVLSRPGTQKQFADNVEQLIESISDSTDLIIVEPKPDKRSSYYKFLKKKTEFKNFDELGPRELPRWLSEQAKHRGGSLSTADANYLTERIGPNEQLLANELDKLLTYDPKITRQTIDLLTDTAPQSTIFQLLDAAFTGNKIKTIQLYEEQRALKVEPIQIIAMLAWQLHVLATIKAAGNKSAEEISKEAGLSPFVIQKSQPIARNLTMTKLRKLIHDLSQLDVQSKSAPIDVGDALRYYLFAIPS